MDENSDGILVSDGDLNTGADTVTVNTLTASIETGSIDPMILGGRRQGANRESFTGLIDEVRIYDSALTPAEVQALFIPEPSSAFLCGIAIGLGMARRRRSL